jgi:hypothetical protein
MSMIIQNLIKKRPDLRPANRLGCHIPFIEYDKDVLLTIQDKHSHEYMWYHDWLSYKYDKPVNESMFHYQFLPSNRITDCSYIHSLVEKIRKHIPLLKDIDIDYQFVKFDKHYTLEVHTDIGRNTVIFLPLTDNSSPTDFYRNGNKIASFEHTSAMLLAVDIPHGSSFTEEEKITFQFGFTYPDWDELLDYIKSTLC